MGREPKAVFRSIASLPTIATPAPAGTRKRKGEVKTEFAPFLDPIQRRPAGDPLDPLRLLMEEIDAVNRKRVFKQVPNEPAASGQGRLTV